MANVDAEEVKRVIDDLETKMNQLIMDATSEAKGIEYAIKRLKELL